MNIKRWVKGFFFFCFFSLLVYFFYQLRLQYYENINVIKIVHWLYLIVSLFLIVLGTVINGMISNLFWSEQGLKLNFKEWYGLNIINTLLNFIVPMRGGTFSVASYMKRRYDFRVSDFFTALSASYVIIYWVNSLAALCAIAWLYYKEGYISYFLSVFFLVLFLFLSYILLFSPHINIQSNKFISRVIYIINNWYILRNNTSLKLKIVILSIINIAINSSAMFFLFRTLGFEINPTNAVILTIISSVTLVASFTPSNIGIKEAIIAFAGIGLGVPILQTILVSFLDRVLGFTISFLLSAFFLRSLGVSKNPWNWVRKKFSDRRVY